MEIATFYDPEEAYCAQAAVRSGGCYSILYNEHHLGVAPALRIGLEGFRLIVLEQDAADVRNALNGYMDDAVAEIQNAPLPETGRTKRKNWFWFPVALATAVPFLPSYSSRNVLIGQILVSLPFYFIILASLAS